MMRGLHLVAMLCVGCTGVAKLPEPNASDAGLQRDDGGVLFDGGGGVDAGSALRDAGLPAWRVGLEVNAWRELPASSMSLQAPSNEAVLTTGVHAVYGPWARLNAWSGLSIDTRSSTVWSVANGGHGDYFGNEVVRFDLMSDAPRWVEWFAGSSGPVVDGVTAGADPSHARYLDGLPCSTHSYYGQQFLEGQSRAVRLGGSTAPIGSAFENVEGFDISLGQGHNGWAPAGTFGFALGGVNGGWTPAIGWAACKDPTTEIIYVVNAPNLRRFVPSAAGVGGTWSTVGPLPDAINTGALGATAVDTKRHRLLWLKGYGPNSPYTVDLTTGVWSPRAHPDSAAKAAFDALKPSLGMVYVAPLDAFFVRANAAGAAVYRIDAETFEISMLPTTGGDTVAQAFVLSGEENVYTKWLWVPALGGIVYFPKSESNAWFLRLY